MARKYLIETFGCQMNVHDSERMAGLLEQAGYEATDDAGRVDEVARMLAGGQRTEAVQRAARDLLSGAGVDGGERREAGERRKRKS